jgi:undecaprenyl diphosphate synthase
MHDNSDPKHIGIILDGNRTWSKLRNFDSAVGYQKGARRVEELLEYIVTSCSESLRHLTLYCFSTENWGRDIQEVDYLMSFFNLNLKKQLSTFQKYNIKVRALGNLGENRIPDHLKNTINDVVHSTQSNSGLNLYLAFNYGGRQEILSACKGLISKNQTVENFKQHLYAPQMPEVDILIRTGGKQRISNFLLWHIAYAEIYFEKTHWPDFTTSHFKDIVDDFRIKNRTFGCSLPA